MPTERPESTGGLPPEIVHSDSQVRRCAALIVDIAGSVTLRAQLGDQAAGRRIRSLLQAIIAAARAQGGEFIKSYGDDVLAIFEREPVPSAARVAVRAQQLALEAGLQLYAGFHTGDVEFRTTMGHPDALGLTVNIAARLHKLTEGAPGRIFLVEESVAALPADLRSRASRYGRRDLKGVGEVDIWTLGWQADATTVALAPAHAQAASNATLQLRHGATSVSLAPEQKSGIVGRRPDCALCVPDPEPRISSAHLMFEFSAGHWFVQDISRNGTWMRDGGTGAESALPNCKQMMLSRAGVLCLGRPFTEDVEERFRVSFALTAG